MPLGGSEWLPCITLGEGDDAETLEISMIENMLRQNPDQVTQWESYTRLVKEGRSVEDIAATFALTELQVKRILALGNLLPRIRDAFRAEEIDAPTVKHLTLATKAQQKAWLALFEDADGYGGRFDADAGCGCIKRGRPGVQLRPTCGFATPTDFPPTSESRRDDLPNLSKVVLKSGRRRFV